jgi:thioredoxin-related protein
MRTGSLQAVLVWLLSMATCVAADDGPIWLRDLEQAKAEAKSAGKDLFILFTAPARFQACGLFDREVFQQSNFANDIWDNYIFLRFDFSLGDSPEDSKRRAELMQLRTHFLAPVLPTVVLADSAGVPYALMTGYSPETTVNSYLGQIAQAREARKKRDELLATADSHSGEIRAQYLSDALACIEPHLGSIAQRGDDPLLHFYADRVDQILELAAGRGDLADKYIRSVNDVTNGFQEFQLVKH